MLVGFGVGDKGCPSPLWVFEAEELGGGGGMRAVMTRRNLFCVSVHF